MRFRLRSGLWEIERRQIFVGRANCADVCHFDLAIDLVAIDRQVARCPDANFHAIGIDSADVDLDLVSNHDPLVDFTGQDQHRVDLRLPNPLAVRRSTHAGKSIARNWQ